MKSVRISAFYQLRFFWVSERYNEFKYKRWNALINKRIKTQKIRTLIISLLAFKENVLTRYNYLFITYFSVDSTKHTYTYEAAN